MSKRLALVVVVSWLALGVLFSPSLRAPALATTQERRVTVRMATEAWYQRLVPCDRLLNCSPLPPVNPYPEDTLHVSSVAGQESARTYLAFDLSIPSTAVLASGTLRLPVDTNPQHGSLRADRALMVACLATEEFEAVRGSLAPAPAIDCNTSAPASWDEEDGSFTVDLAAFLATWQSGRAALALVPAPADGIAPQAWHVVFPATPKEDSEGPAITAALTYTSGQVDSGGPSGTIPPPDIPSTGGSGVGFGPFPQAPSPQPTTLPTAPVVQPLYPGGFAGLGFAYPIIWALPLVVLAGVGAIGRALTKELYRRTV